MTDNLNHFLTLASRGESAAGSSGEHAAYRMAHAVLDDVPTLDEAALRGLTIFVGITKYQPIRAREMLETVS